MVVKFSLCLFLFFATCPDFSQFFLKDQIIASALLSHAPPPISRQFSSNTNPSKKHCRSLGYGEMYALFNHRRNDYDEMQTNESDFDRNGDQNNTPSSRHNRRRIILTALTASTAFLPISQASAASSKSRTEGYSVQRSEREWAYVLSGKQYNILRQGGTERPNSSILESEDRSGTFVCAACTTELFESSKKFHSGTGWPSFAAALPGVEVEDVNPIQANLAGAELRCGTCGGHLGDVFNDGKLYVNTPAFLTGKRFCIDGSALVFKPQDGSEDVYGDLAPPAPKTSKFEEFLKPPQITPVSR
mmetsp:Transcript_24205/g.35382  ORF Transcript_24205/g.35382 Transcript_24205/m.35382 type:complete len:303 (+) Transcript_24205:1-909(+)